MKKNLIQLPDKLKLWTSLSLSLRQPHIPRMWSQCTVPPVALCLGAHVSCPSPTPIPHPTHRLRILFHKEDGRGESWWNSSLLSLVIIYSSQFSQRRTPDFSPRILVPKIGRKEEQHRSIYKIFASAFSFVRWAIPYYTFCTIVYSTYSSIVIIFCD